MGGIVEDITPWNDESEFGQVATGLTIGAATAVAGGAAGLGLYGAMAAGGLAAAGYAQSEIARKQREDAMERMREQAKQRTEGLKEKERRRRAAIRREMLAGQVISGAMRANPTDTAFEKREYENKVPSLENTINMSGE